ncbi:hypothetical protein CIT292_11266 [Citrobacter youngae ATCC 29220]|uniref:Uncharacterized protein n=1 Tax=Citrobacter youngae ATCC 29220 TaxID=500640 RepID=D4BL26_9ENTR|nr:hypothetical protein CIT292_11266 [Citrobacter youngae ATCC 29220]
MVSAGKRVKMTRRSAPAGYFYPLRSALCVRRQGYHGEKMA